MNEIPIKEALISALCIIAEQEKLLFENHAMIRALRETLAPTRSHHRAEYEILFHQEMTGVPALDSAEKAESIVAIAKQLKNL
jgi:hypothetical protein